ncbi:hypothetical protein KP509_22G002200 [Ceratopteris richardii]|uniref:Uncharacterized protein n=1 Tax=Ceratopteris richardii TaxID=49495 RepID=A0A8T2S242_CERRI|nr:hypothetical protein KP509_22G002200 [Ceratopteris richardii]
MDKAPQLTLWEPPEIAMQLLKELEEKTGGKDSVQDGGGTEADEREVAVEGIARATTITASQACCRSLRRFLQLSWLLPKLCKKALGQAEAALHQHVKAAVASAAAAGASEAAPQQAMPWLVDFSRVARCSETLLALMARYNDWAPRTWGSMIVLLQNEAPLENPAVLRSSLARNLHNLNHFAEEFLSCYEELRKMSAGVNDPLLLPAPIPRPPFSRRHLRLTIFLSFFFLTSLALAIAIHRFHDFTFYTS